MFRLTQQEHTNHSCQSIAGYDVDCWSSVYLFVCVLGKPERLFWSMRADWPGHEVTRQPGQMYVLCDLLSTEFVFIRIFLLLLFCSPFVLAVYNFYSIYLSICLSKLLLSFSCYSFSQFFFPFFFISCVFVRFRLRFCMSLVQRCSSSAHRRCTQIYGLLL